MNSTTGSPKHARVRRVDVKHLLLGPDGEPFEGEALVRFHSADSVVHAEFQEREAKLLARFEVGAVAVAGRWYSVEPQPLGRWYRVEHDCARRKGQGGVPCMQPNPAPGSALIREAQIALGRPLRLDEELDPAVIFPGALVARIETVARVYDREKKTFVPSGGAYSKVAAIVGRCQGAATDPPLAIEYRVSTRPAQAERKRGGH